jgi:hypothetical protein
MQPSTSILICEVTTGVSKIKLLFKFTLAKVFPVATVVDPPTGWGVHTPLTKAWILIDVTH